MQLYKILGTVTREGMKLGYTPNKVLEMYSKEQKKLYDSIGKVLDDKLNEKSYRNVLLQFQNVRDIAFIAQYRGQTFKSLYNPKCDYQTALRKARIVNGMQEYRK